MSYLTREDLEQREEAILAPYASKCRQTRGRDVTEKPGLLRTEYQRDRDRILHCAAFRKLEYKTQVYVTHEGENFRTRLTHTFEVAQIARTLACNLGLNADLTEAIALAHDLGHTPFGHTGERVLKKLMAADGGFEHNAQSLRVVEVLEERFCDRPGLNLTWEVREGIAHHSKAPYAPAVQRYHEGLHPSLEAQLVDVADEIAYNHHDMDDAMRMGLLDPEQLGAVPWVGALWEDAKGQMPQGSDPSHRRNRFLGLFVDRLVHGIIENVSRRLEEEGIDSAEAVREHKDRLGCYDESAQADHAALHDFLMQQVYRHPTTLKMQSKAGRFLNSLFEFYLEQPHLLPQKQQDHIRRWGLKRVLADYLSGLTDRHCQAEYRLKIEPGENLPGAAALTEHSPELD